MKRKNKKPKKLSIIIPVYNEESTISELISKVKKVKIPLKKELIVIDDCSNDNSLKILKKIKGIRLLNLEKNKGKGFAIREGLKHTTGDIIIIQDADLEYNIKNYSSLLEPFLSQDADVVYGSRLLKKNPKAGQVFFLGGIFLTFLTNLLYRIKITDEPTCYKLFKADIIKKINLNCKRFEFCPEVTAKIAKQGIKIYEVPIDYNPRSIKQGKKIRFKDGLIAIWTLLKYRFID